MISITIKKTPDDLKDHWLDLMDYALDIDQEDLIQLDDSEFNTLDDLIESLDSIKIDKKNKQYMIKSLKESFEIPE